MASSSIHEARVEPITLTVIAILTAWGATKVARLTWSAIRDWLSGHKVPQGTGEIIGEKIARGEYAVVANVFSPQGTRITRQKWRAAELDNELAGELQKAGGKIVVKF